MLCKCSPMVSPSYIVLKTYSLGHHFTTSLHYENIHQTSGTIPLFSSLLPAFVDSVSLFLLYKFLYIYIIQWWGKSRVVLFLRFHLLPPCAPLKCHLNRECNIVVMTMWIGCILFPWKMYYLLYTFSPKWKTDFVPVSVFTKARGLIPISPFYKKILHLKQTNCRSWIWRNERIS